MNDRIDHWHRSDRVFQAQGMVSVQADCTVDEALDKMTDRAQESETSLEAIATAIIERRIRFTL
jgi:hypothetical protein